MPGMPHAPYAKWRVAASGMAAGSADLDQARRCHSELGGPRSGAGRLAGSYRGPGRETVGGWNGTERRAPASADAHLPYGAARCARDCGISEVVADRGALALRC